MIRSTDNRSDMDSTREAEVVALRKRVKELELQLEIEQEARRRESRTVQNLLMDALGNSRDLPPRELWREGFEGRQG